jgi:hypothetical protein
MANGKTRRYGNKGRLLTWIQLRCVVCGHFLCKNKKKYCTECSKIKVVERKKLWKQEHYSAVERKAYHIRTGK